MESIILLIGYYIFFYLYICIIIYKRKFCT